MKQLVAAALVLAVTATAVRAQQTFEFPKPQKEHEWLQQLVGDWETEMEVTGIPGTEKSILSSSNGRRRR